MHFRHLSFLALASLVSAQDNNANGTQSLNATLSSNDQLSNLTSFLSTNPALVSALSNANNITILAPSNEAFSAFANTSIGQAIASDSGILAALLQYHVLNGTYQASQISNQSAFIPTLLNNETYANVTGGQVVEAVRVGNETVFYSGLLQNSTVTTADQNFTGGTVHIVDRVLVFPISVLDTANALNLTSFRGAVNATDSIPAASQRNVTIFAPNNEAFNNVGSAFANLSSDDLRSIVEYHVVDSIYYSPELTNGTTLQSADNGTELRITTNENGTVFVNAAEVVVPNVLIANGVLHVVDNVLNPNNTSAPSPSATSGAPGFSGTPDASGGQPFTSGQPTPTTQVNPTSEGAGPAQSTAAHSSSSSGGAVMPAVTGAAEYAAIVGAGVGAMAWLGL